MKAPYHDSRQKAYMKPMEHKSKVALHTKFQVYAVNVKMSKKYVW
jgi:hypothetical protein